MMLKLDEQEADWLIETLRRYAIGRTAETYEQHPTTAEPSQWHLELARRIEYAQGK